ncbi:MAG TPA: M20/M25/M40 family metallo-hydrolase [Chitinophagaceae bacterium]|nr:M20/M25/M40 family metallo-hydrolase [Chitinophagaceae bacterium]
MRKMTTTLLALFAGLFLMAQEKLDLDMVQKIRQEGLNNSKVMDIAFYLTDVNGPRLAGSPGYTKAANWAKNELAKWGLVNASLEPWGEFGKSWELQKSYVALTAPYYKPMIAYPKTWTKGSGGLKNAEVLLVDAKDSTELVAYKGKFKGKIVVLYRNDTLKHSFRADAVRYTDEELDRMANAAPPEPRRPMDTAQIRRMRAQMGAGQASARVAALTKEWAAQEGAAALLSYSMRGHDGTLFVQGGGAYTKGSPDNFLDIMVTAEDYLSICRLAKAGIPVKLEVDVKTTSNEKDTKGYNVVAEIPGTDPTLKEEIVMLGGHLDSWHSATGATDNAAGTAVMMEAVRILKALGVKPRRTIRIALWGGEEQGLHGSRGYVKNHFADPADMKLKPEHSKFSAYYNIDNGTGKVRGIYLQGNDKVKDIFTKWLEPFHDLGAKTVTISNTGGTDHQSFDAVGLPGFQFIQDPIEYSTRTHHTNMDSYDHLIADDLKQISTIVASFVYHTAMRDEKLPRKELPQPRTGGRGF